MFRGQVILVEDDDLQRKVYGDFLKANGFSVIPLRRGQDAVDFIEASPIEPGTVLLVILDIMMPGMDGFETCRQIRKIVGDSVPILFLTGGDRQMDLLHKAFAAGGDEYLLKDGRFNEFLQCVRRWAGRSAKSAVTRPKLAVG
jgi:DNA-binding response OmpR family regulator